MNLAAVFMLHEHWLSLKIGGSVIVYPEQQPLLVNHSLMIETKGFSELWSYVLNVCA
jgi:hypothetical protein